MAFSETLSRYAKVVKILPKAFAQAPVGTINKRLVMPLRRRASRARWFVRDQNVRLLDKAKGVSAGNVLFWKQSNTRPWGDVDDRLRYLHDNWPDAVDEFARYSYSVSFNPSVLVNLGRSALTQDCIRDQLLSEDIEPGSALAKRMRGSQMVCSAIVVLSTLLLDEQRSKKISELATKCCPEFSKNFLSVIDSCGFALGETAEHDIRARLPSSGFRARKKKRLILVQSITDVKDISLLCHGADEATVFALGDLYGRADFTDELLHLGDCDVVVEHARSGITRFSSEYHRVHEETREVSEALVSELSEASKSRLPVYDHAGMALALADYLFFPCLQFVAIQRLIASDEFDHIVIGFNPTSAALIEDNEQFCQLLLGMPGLNADKRVELVCTSMSSIALQKFEEYSGRLTFGSAQSAPSHARHLFLETAINDLKKKSLFLVQGFQEWPESKNRRVLLATSQVAAYNRSSAAYCDALSKNNDLRVAFMGGNLMSFAVNMDTTLSSDDVYTIPQRPHGQFELTKIWLENFLRKQIPHIKHDYISYVVESKLKQVVENGLLSFIAHSYLCDVWFSQLKSKGQLPELVVLTPFRSVRVAALAAVARRYGVPSFAVEPHGLNASYCRYSKVTADYYGVVSTFFAGAAVEGFGMSLDRSPVVGSPRLETSKDYDLVVETARARAEITEETQLDLATPRAVLTFFSQPSDWDQVSDVWTTIIKATEALDCLLILKPHPEETSSRVEAYLKVGKDLGAHDRIQVVNADAKLLIEASDLVLSSYSATVVEATLLRRPVFCVTNSGADYPLNQHDVIGGKSFGSPHDLRVEIESFLENPTSYNEVPETFLKAEPQFTDGFATHLEKAVSDICALPAEEAIRPVEDVPASLFLDGPHTVYKV